VEEKNAMDTIEILRYLEHEKQCIEDAIAALNGSRAKMRRGGRGKQKKTMSAAARRRISLAQKRRWKAQKAKTKA
jgi:hypothetical protein